MKALRWDMSLGIISIISVMLSITTAFLLGAMWPGITWWMWIGAFLILLCVARLLVFILWRSPGTPKIILTRVIVIWLALALAPMIPLFGLLLIPQLILLPVIIVPIAVLVLIVNIIQLLRARILRGVMVRCIVVAILALASLYPALAGSTDWLHLNDNIWAMHLGMRQAIVAKVSLVELQKATINLIELDRGRRSDVGPSFIYDSEIQRSSLVPSTIKRLKPRYLSLYRGEGKKDSYIHIGWGGGLMSMGLNIGAPGYTEETSRNVRYWSAGIYSWVE